MKAVVDQTRHRMEIENSRYPQEGGKADYEETIVNAGQKKQNDYISQIIISRMNIQLFIEMQGERHMNWLNSIKVRKRRNGLIKAKCRICVY